MYGNVRILNFLWVCIHLLCHLFLAEMQEGDTLHGYTINSVTDVPEFDLVAVQLTHNRTGAKHLHLARDDDNNSFGYVKYGTFALFRAT